MRAGWRPRRWTWGQYLRAGDKVATIFCTEAAEITVYLESADLGWINAPGLTGNGAPGSPAQVQVDFAGRALSWEGRVVRTGAKVDERTRLVPVVVRVDKPYARRPPLTVGLFAKVTIQGRELDSAAMIPRSALRQGDVVWVVGQGNDLKFRKVSVAHFQRDTVMIRGGLKSGERVVVSSLGEVTDGMLVRPVTAAREDNS